MKSFYEQPPAKWAKKNRALAYEARSQAAHAGRQRQSLLMLAGQWEALACNADVDGLAEVQK
jgi:hypothetical protein